MSRRAKLRTAPWSAFTSKVNWPSRRASSTHSSTALIGKLHAAGDFAGKLGDTLLLPQSAGAATARVLLIGLGSTAGFGRKQYRKALQAAAVGLAKTGSSDAILYLTLEEVPDLDTTYRCRMVSEVFSVQAYKIRTSRPAPNRSRRVLPSSAWRCRMPGASKAAESGLAIGKAIGSGIAFARDLANLPPNICTPTYLGSRALRLAKEWPSIKATVIDLAGIKALKMGLCSRSLKARSSRPD